MCTLRIRPAKPTDLAALIEELGQEPFFADRIDRQLDGRGLLLTAWLDNRPIGDAYLWLEPAEEPPIREFLPGTPLLTHVEIHPHHRRQGHGTELIGTAEQVLASGGHEQVALAVEKHNHDAFRLYYRLRYREWPRPMVECLTFADGTGSRRTEICRIMTKRLDASRLPSQPQ